MLVPYLKEVLGLSEHVHDAYQAGGACQTANAVVIWVLPPWQLKAAVPVRTGRCWGNMDELALHGTALWEDACILYDSHCIMRQLKLSMDIQRMYPRARAVCTARCKADGADTETTSFKNIWCIQLYCPGTPPTCTVTWHWPKLAYSPQAGKSCYAGQKQMGMLRRGHALSPGNSRLPCAET